MRISKYSEFNLQSSLTRDFIQGFDSIIQEGDDLNSYKKVEKKVIADLKLNSELVLTFGTGIGSLYPIVSKLMSNLKTDTIEVTPHTVVLLTIASFTIIYLEEKKSKSPVEEAQLTKDSKSMLEELKLRGIGNGIVKKVIKAIKSIKNIFNLVTKHIGAVVGGIMDMFAYTSILIPFMNAVLYVVGKYDMNIDSIIQNFLTLSMGIGTVIARHGIAEIINKLRGRIPIRKEVVDELETPIIQKFGDMTHGDDTNKQGGDLIKEQ